MIRRLKILLLLIGIHCSLLGLQSSHAQEEAPVAIFNNTKFYASDIYLDERLKAKKQASMPASDFSLFEYTYRMELLARQIHSRLKNRILNQYQYYVTETELNGYLKYIRWIRNNPYFKSTPEQRFQLKGKIADWHFNSLIYQQYGGEVIATPSGYKPIGAYKALVDDMLKKNIFILTDLAHRGCLTILYVYFEKDTKNKVSQELADSYFLNPHWGKYGIDIKEDKMYKLPPKK